MSVVSVGDCSVALLAGCVPNLGPDKAILNFDGLSCKFHSDGGRGLALELVLGVSEKQLGFADFRVPNQHQLEHVVVACPAHLHHILLREELLISRHVC